MAWTKEKKQAYMKAYCANYYLKNKEKLKKRVRDRWRENPEAKVKDKLCRDKRREEIRAYDRMRSERDQAKKKIIIERWKSNNPERWKTLAISRSHRRRARLRSAGGTWSPEDVEKAIIAQKNTCWWCSKKLSKKYHVDHRFPLGRGGTNNVDNIVISCAPCNFSKNAKMPWEFAGRLL